MKMIDASPCFDMYRRRRATLDDCRGLQGIRAARVDCCSRTHTGAAGYYACALGFDGFMR